MRKFINWKLETGNWKLMQGFTMIELLMVMGILSVLTGFVVVTYPASQKRVRDTRRKSDIKQYQTALELYANKNNGSYPTTASATLVSMCATLGLSNCPDDPKATASQYKYFGNASGSSYVIYATLEKPYTSGVSTYPYFVTCSTGISGFRTSQPTDSNCPNLFQGT